MKITVVSVFVKGHVPFTPVYVTKLESMVRRALPGCRFVCLTDRADELPDGIETIQAKPVRGMYGWWAKVQLFNSELPLAGRVLYLDLDVLVVGDLDAVVNFPAKFALVPDGAPLFKPRDGKRCVKRFNSSVMVWNHREQSKIYSQWSPKEAEVLWGDQDWIGQCCPEATAMPSEWFPRLSDVKQPPWSDKARVILCKKPKNSEAMKVMPWFKQVWQ